MAQTTGDQGFVESFNFAGYCGAEAFQLSPAVAANSD
jgi:hypothetical protein